MASGTPLPKQQTLPELLHARAVDGDASSDIISLPEIYYLDSNGRVYTSYTYAVLLRTASTCALRLLAAGLTSSDIVLTSFPDHERHVLFFWACCLAGIAVCPLPPLHPDASRQAMLFNHLQRLFHRPTLIAPKAVIESAQTLVPELKGLASDSEALEADLKPKNSLKRSGEIYPARRVLPGDTACFMLTSGSTGNSKAVQLTHANLLSSVRGKIEHHGTSKASRFFNWIAFDHVACVSEIHIHALEVNASQWLVTPAAVIANPRHLLEWSSTYRITYTFSPNFLLAQILRDIAKSGLPHQSALASPPIDLSNLRCLISGGESVPIKTAIALADLVANFGAPRDVLRAGFGMSETGAGCIYDRRPIPAYEDSGAPKYLSLGTCCPGVEMRVVEPETGIVCPSRVPGQFQIKGPTVFAGYYGNERATQESFIVDREGSRWFITGDVGQIDAEGNLFFMGRDKDCLNINGIKHPVQDVEHYVENARIDGVTHGHVYVCPMRLAEADTETYGVFYQHEIVVEDGTPDAGQKYVIDAANQAITKACTLFCAQAPHIVLPLPRASFVKTSLGKVSRSQLAGAYLQGSFNELQQAFEILDRRSVKHNTMIATDLHSPIEKIVLDAVSSIFVVESSVLQRSTNIFDMGASSMHLLRLKQLIQTRLSLSEIPIIEIIRRPELGVLCEYISELAGPGKRGKGGREGSPADYHPLVRLSSHGTKPPVFLVHPGVGEVLVFIGLARALAGERPVYALRAKGFDHEDTMFKSFEEMVENYTAAIEKERPGGPYYVAGYSFGSVVAFEIGKRLETKGNRVPWLGVFNLPPHIQWRMNQLTWTEVLLNIAMFLSLITSSSLDSLRHELEEKFPKIVGRDMEPQIPHACIKWLFERLDKARFDALDLNLGAFTRWVKVAYELNRTGRTFEPQGCIKGALTTIFCATPLPSMGTKTEYKRKRLSVWKEFSGRQFEMVDVDGDHYTMLSDEHVESFAKHMLGALGRADECRS